MERTGNYHHLPSVLVIKTMFSLAGENMGSDMSDILRCVSLLAVG
jgi:hypothetical protein